MNRFRLAFCPGRWLLALAIALVLSACDGSSPPSSVANDTTPSKSKVRIVCTTPLIHEIMSHFSGDRLESHCLFTKGHSLATADLNGHDLLALREADVVIMHGVAQEDALLAAVQASARTGRTDIRLFDAEGKAPSSAGMLNVPAMSPADYIELVQLILPGLAQLDPHGPAASESRKVEFLQGAQELSAWLSSQVAAIAEAHRTVITDDEMTASIIRGIGLHAVLVAPIQGDVPTRGDRDRLLAQMRESKARAIAIDTRGSEAMTEMLADIARETGSRVIKQGLIAWPSAEVGYVAMMKANAHVVFAALRK